MDISASVKIADGEDPETIKARFKAGLNSYWLEVAQEATDDTAKHTGYIRWVQVGATLAKTSGVIDYTGLTVNGGTANIPISQSEYPVTGEVTLNVQT